MPKKNEFSELVKDVDRKFQEIETRKKTVSERLKKLDQKNQQETVDPRKLLIEERKARSEFLLKEKLTNGIVVFVIGQMILIPICFRHPEIFAQLWLFGSISLGVIAIAVIDYS